MNTYLREFLQADFTPWRPQQVYHSTDVRYSELPVVEISGFDLGRLSRAEHLVRGIVDQFGKVPSQDFFRHWWTRDVRSQGWTELSVIDQEDGVNLVHNPIETISLPPKPQCQNAELRDLLLDILQGVPLQKLTIFRLEPNGWIQPHMDTMRDKPGLSYFWMPMHDFPACLKIWPYGWLHHRPGNMYLFNYSRYVHAAINQSSQDRFVLSGRIELSNLPDWFVEQFNKADQTHHRLWTRS